MALAFRPHSWTVYAASQAIIGGQTVSPNFTVGATVRGQISGMTSERAYATYGVEVTRGYEALMNVGDAEQHRPGDRIHWGSRWFSVKTAPKVLDHGLECDNAAMLVEEIRNDA